MWDQALVSVDRNNVIIETVKKAEDGEGIIVRLYENERSRCKATLQAGFSLQAAHICNLLEEDQTQLEVEAGSAVSLNIKPYQIVTLRLIPA